MLTTCERINAKAATEANFHKLDNGLTLIHQEISTTSAVTVDVWVEAGTITEPDEWTGIAHFLEHMIFKGTDKIKPGQFDCIIESHGGVANAATSHDYAHYMFTTTSNHFGNTLSHLAEMLLCASIPEQEFIQERLVVIEEIHQALDDPDWLAYQHLLQAVYQHHPYSRSVLGTQEILQGLTPEHMRQYHQSRYRPELMTVVVVGAVSLAETMDLVSRAFDLPIASVNNNRCHLGTSLPNFSINSPDFTQFIAQKASKSQLGIQGINRHINYLPRLQHSRLTMAWLGASVSSWEDALQLELCSVILAGGRSARLVKELREELGWVLDIGSGFSMQREPGLFTINAYLDACYLEPVEHKIQQHVADLTTNLVSSTELNRAKRTLLNNFAFAMESPHQLASFLGYHGMLGCENFCENWSTVYGEIVAKVEPENLQDLARKYLPAKNYTITHMIPET